MLQFIFINDFSLNKQKNVISKNMFILKSNDELKFENFNMLYETITLNKHFREKNNEIVLIAKMFNNRSNNDFSYLNFFRYIYCLNTMFKKNNQI